MKKIVVILLVGFILIQFFPINKKNPPVNKGMDFLTIKNIQPPIASLIRNSCYDCHSNETHYPWYASVAPASWIIKNHVDDGRIHLNFSTFATYEPSRQIKKMQKAAELIGKREMPLESYFIGHQDAKLTDEQRQQLVDFFKREIRETQIKNWGKLP